MRGWWSAASFVTETVPWARPQSGRQRMAERGYATDLLQHINGQMAEACSGVNSQVGKGQRCSGEKPLVLATPQSDAPTRLLLLARPHCFAPAGCLLI